MSVDVTQKNTVESPEVIIGTGGIWLVALGFFSFFIGAYIENKGLPISSALFVPVLVACLILILVAMFACKVWCDKGSDGKFILPTGRPIIRLAIRTAFGIIALLYGWIVAAGMSIYIVSQ